MKAIGYEDARSWAAHWAQRWFLGPDGEDRLNAGSGVDAGWATHVEAYLLLLAFALEYLGQSQQQSSVAGRIKRLGLDRGLRLLGLRAMSIGGNPVTPPGHPVAVVVEIPTPSMLEPARLVAAALPAHRRTVACADPRALRALRKAHLNPQALVLPLSEQRRCLKTQGVSYVAALAGVASKPPLMVLGDEDLGKRAVAMLQRSMARSLPWIAPEHRALVRLVERTQPRSFVVASDQHRIGRLVTEVARSHGAPVTVLQHGMPQGDVGYLPVVASRVASWSTEAAQWFIERGTDPSGVEVLGNPRLDPILANSNADSRKKVVGLRMLLALSPSAVSTNEVVLASVLDAMDSLPSAELVVKLHPGHREWGWVRRVVTSGRLKDRVRIAHREDLGPLLRWADVTLVHRSTVALESIALGKPVIVILSDLPSAAEVELRGLDLPRARNAGEVVAALRALQDPDVRTSWLRERRSRITQHAGPLDGRSAERIAGALLNDEWRG